MIRCFKYVIIKVFIMKRHNCRILNDHDNEIDENFNEHILSNITIF